MKKNYTLIFLMLFSLIGYAQNFDHIYSDTVEGSAVEINFNDISACQSNVVLNITEFRNLSYPTNLCANLFVKYKVFVNDVEIGDYCTGEAQSFDLSTYGAINNVKIVGYNTYNDIDDTIKISANLVVSSSLVAMPATGPTTSELSYCLNTSATALTATLTGGATRLKWYTTNSGGLTSNSVIPNTSVLGSTIYWVSQADAVGCESERSSVVVTVYDTPNVPTAEAQEFCESRTVADLVPELSATIVWYDVETEGVILSSTTELTTGTYYVSEVNANGCESERVSVNVTVNSILAPIAEAQAFCASGTVADLVPSPSSTILWYDVETEGVALSTTTDLVTGAYYVSESNANGCESERTSVSVTVGSIVQVDAGGPTVTFCDNDIMPITATTSINGFKDNYAPSNWTFLNTNSDGNIDTSNVPNSIVLTGGNNGSHISGNSSYSILCAIETTISFDWNYTTSDFAGSHFDYPQVLVNGIAMAFDNYGEALTQSGTIEVTIPAGETFGINMFTTDNYSGSASVQISNFVASTEGNISSYSWAATDGGTITGSTTSASMIPATSGTYTVTATDTNGCTVTDSIDVTINEVLEAPTALAQSFCGSATGADLEATGTNLTWYTSETSETVLESTLALATGSYYVSQSTNGCESERTEVSVTVNDIPEAPTASAQVFCGSATITDLEATGTNLTWYTSETSETVLESTSAVATGSYYVSQSTNGCESERTMVNVTISDIPEVPIVTALVTYSQGDDASVLTATSVGLDLAWYEAETGGISDSEAPTPSTETIGSTSYWVASVSDDGCYSERVQIVVTVEEVLGVGDHNLLNAIKVYPNPTDGQVSIMLPSANKAKITVYDLNGRLLLNKACNQETNVIDISRFENGVYLLKVISEFGEISTRVIKK